MSQFLDLISDAPLSGWALIIMATARAVIVMASGAVATFHPSRARRDSALLVLGALQQSRLLGRRARRR